MLRAAAFALLLASCTGTAPGEGGSIDAPGGGGTDAPGGDGPIGGLEGGSLTVSWMHGSQNCNANADPELQVHAYNATIHIIRQKSARRSRRRSST